LTDWSAAFTNKRVGPRFGASRNVKTVLRISVLPLSKDHSVSDLKPDETQVIADINLSEQQVSCIDEPVMLSIPPTPS
jgi:hypothetical protein